MHARVGERVSMLGYLIHVKATDTRHGQRMTFGSFIDTAGDFWDSSAVPRCGCTLLVLWTRGVSSHGLCGRRVQHVALRTQHFEKLPWNPDPRYGAK